MIVREPATFEKAQAHCESTGGELVSVENGNELKHALRLSNEVNREIWLAKMRDYLKAAVDVVASGQAENIDIDRLARENTSDERELKFAQSSWPSIVLQLLLV